MATVLHFPPRGPRLAQALRDLRARIAAIPDAERERRMREFEDVMTVGDGPEPAELHPGSAA